MSTAAASTNPFFVWEGVYNSYQEAAGRAEGAGFGGSTYRQRSINAAQECIAALSQGIPIPPFHKQRSTLLPCTVAMILSRQQEAKIIDFGGGLGIGYMTLQESLPGSLERIRYNILEVPEVAQVGEKLLTGNVCYINSFSGIEQTDLVHAASSFQYVEDWKGLIQTFAAVHSEYILLSDVFAGAFDSFATLQNYYESKIPHWFLNLCELLQAFEDCGYELLMKTYATSRRADAVDVLPMDNFPEHLRLPQTLHSLLQKCS